jgi:energy-coupling factor transporter transmembrane protein EcfT
MTYLFHAKIHSMKAKLPQHPEHYSYLKHRKQRVTQIILPVVISTLVFIGLIVLISLVTFTQEGDVGRWAAISTIWIVIPIMVVGLILLVLLIGLIYLLARAIGGLPYYTGIGQDYVYKAQAYIIRAANIAIKPVIVLNSWLETIKAFFERVTP